MWLLSNSFTESTWKRTVQLLDVLPGAGEAGDHEVDGEMAAALGHERI